MPIVKSRWSKVYESSEEELIDLLEAQGYAAKRWHIDAFEKVEPQQHQENMIIWCAEGSAMVHSTGKDISIQPGDFIRVPAGTTYEIDAGMTGCACYQIAN